MYLIKLNQTEEQKKALFLAYQAGAFRDIAAMRGDKGSQRKKLTTKEVHKRKVRLKMAKASRKKNRKSA
jgi:hypothetical protein